MGIRQQYQGVWISQWAKRAFVLPIRHLVLRLMGCFVLLYTSPVICKGRLTMEEIIFSLKHY